MSRAWVVDGVGAEAFEKLASELPGTELQSVLLEVMRRRAQARSPAEVLAQYRRDGFVRPGAVDLRTSLAIDTELLAAATGFEGLDLSPVTPLGTSSTVAPSDQHRVLSALRGTEVVSDPTNVFALECAERLQRAPATPVHLATSMRVVRAQPVPKLPGFTPNFRLFALGSAGRERANHGFAVETLALHVTTLMRGLDRLETAGYAFGARRVVILARPEQEVIADRLAAALAIPSAREVLTHAYYSGGIRFMVWVTTKDGNQLPIGDGGLFDWMATLTTNRKNVFVASGLGAGLIGFMFRAT